MRNLNNTQFPQQSNDSAILREFVSLHNQNKHLKDEVQLLQNSLRNLLVRLDNEESRFIAQEFQYSDSWSGEKTGDRATQILCKRAEKLMQRVKKQA